MNRNLNKKDYVLYSQSIDSVSQLNASKNQLFASLFSFVVLLVCFVVFGADYLSDILYDNKISEFKKNYQNFSSNLSLIQDKLKELDNHVSAIEKKDDALRNYAGMPMIDKDIRKFGIGGVDISGHGIIDNLAPAINYELSSLQMNLEKLSRQINFELVSYESIYEKVKMDIDRIRHIPSIRPVDGGFLNSSFGYRQDPIDKVRRFHQGQDITVPSGTPVFSPADGIIKRAYYIGGFGNHIKIKHANGYSTIFAHLSNIDVKHGDKVNRGDVIGYTGNTGRSTAPHLHYEVHHNGTPKNPLDYFFSTK